MAAKGDGVLALVADAILGKPFEMVELLATVERLAGQRGGKSGCSSVTCSCEWRA